MAIPVSEKQAWKQTRIEWYHHKMIKEITSRAPVQGLYPSLHALIKLPLWQQLYQDSTY